MAADRHLETVDLDEPLVADARAHIVGVLSRGLAAPQAMLGSFEQEFQFLVEAQEGAYVEAWAAAGHGLEETEEEIRRLAQVGAGMGRGRGWWWYCS